MIGLLHKRPASDSPELELIMLSMASDNFEDSSPVMVFKMFPEPIIMYNILAMTIATKRLKVVYFIAKYRHQTLKYFSQFLKEKLN